MTGNHLTLLAFSVIRGVANLQKWRAKIFHQGTIKRQSPTLILLITMKVSTDIAIIIAVATSALRGAAARSIVTPLSGIDLFPAANYEIDVNAAQANSIDGLGRLYGRLGLTRAYGAVSLSPALLGRIEEKVGRDNVNAAMDVVSQVQTLRLTGTSPWHTDCERDKVTQKCKKLIKNRPLQVGLFFSNTNEDAYLETQDGELCIPIVEETFVSFNGRLPHRTVVMSGHVDMVGPFSLSSDVLLNVGVSFKFVYPFLYAHLCQ